MSTIKDSKTQGQTVYIECPWCKTDTKHTVERALDWSGSSEDGDIQAWGTCQIVRCNGCDTFSFRSTYGSSEDWPGGDIEELYPERAKRSLTDELYLRGGVYDVPAIIQSIYRETLSAVQHDLSTLAGVGVRSIIEALCVDRDVKGRSLEVKIDKLKEQALLTSDGAEILHRIRLLGNAAAHKIKPPTTKQISAALKVIDHLLLGVYVLPKEALILPEPKPQSANTVPKREAKNKQKPHGEANE